MPEEFDERVAKRMMPHSDVAEVSVLGSMILDREAIAIATEYLHKEDFYNPHYGVIFDTMVELNESGEPVDAVTLLNRLRETDLPPGACSVDKIQELVDSVPTSSNVKYYATIVQQKSTLRQLIRANEEIAAKCYQDQDDLEIILGETEQKVFNLVQHRNTDELTPIRTVVKNAINRIEKAYHSSGVVTGIPTGFTDLDFKTAGMQPSDLVLIAARPSMGKTAFVLNLAQNMAMKQKKHVFIFSLEMSKEQLINRMFSLQSSLDAQKLRTGNLDMADWDRLTTAASEIGASNLMIDDTPGISIAQLRSKCRKMKMTQGLDVIIIDYLQLMTGNGRSESRQNEISEISRSLKAIARELSVPVLALSQLSRKVEEREDHRPMLSDLRESGAIEQDADVVMFIYRDDYYHKDTEKKGMTEIIIAKQRNGPIGTVDLVWIPELTKFGNVDHKGETRGTDQ